MTKRMKRFLSLTCALTMLSGIVGCFADPYKGDPVESQPGTAVSAESVTEPGTDPEPAAQPAQKTDSGKAGEKQNPGSGKTSTDGNPEEETPDGIPEEGNPDGTPEEGTPEEMTPEEENPEEVTSEEEIPGEETPEEESPEPEEASGSEEPAAEDAAPQSETDPDENSQPETEPAEETQPEEPEEEIPQEQHEENQQEIPESEGEEEPSQEPQQDPPAAQEPDNGQNPGENVQPEPAAGQNEAPDHETNPSEGEEPHPEEAASAPEDENADEDQPDNEVQEDDEDEDLSSLKELFIDGSPIRETVTEEEPVRLVIKPLKTEKILLTVTLAVQDEIRLKVDDKQLDSEEITVDKESGRQTIEYTLKTEADKLYILEITAEKETEFSIQAAYYKADSTEEAEGDETEETTDIQADEETSEADDSTEESGASQTGESGELTAEDEVTEEPAAEDAAGETETEKDATEEPATEEDTTEFPEAGDGEDSPEAEGTAVSRSGFLAASVSDCTVIVQYGADALFPETVTLSVIEILPGTERYAELTGITEAMLTDDWREAGTFQRVFDLTFLDGDQEIEPAAPIQVDFRFDDPVQLEENSSLQVVHVDNENNAEIVPNDSSAMPAEDSGTVDVDGISFTSDSFSAYVVFQTNNIVSKTIEDEAHNISITYGRENGIPANAQVSVTEIEEGTEAYETFRRQLIQQLNLDESRQTVLFSALYDIAILDENNREVPIQEDTTVTVTAELPVETGRTDELLVVHFDDNGTGADTLEASTEDNVVTFETGGFSVYGFAYTVDYVYEGREYQMQGGSSITLSELFALLDIVENAAEAEKVVFSNPDLIKVERTENDWVLTSLQPFLTEESLTVTLTDGRMIRIVVTDAISASGTLTTGTRANLGSVGTTEKYYAFQPEYDHDYSFDFDTLNTGSTFTFTLYDQNENRIGGPVSRSGYTTQSVVWSMEAGKLYYIGVTRSTNSRTIYVTPKRVNHTNTDENICSVCGEAVSYYVEDGVLHILSNDAMNFTTAASAPWFDRYASEITGIVIEGSVTKIPQNFVNSSAYTKLADVTFADDVSITSFGTYAFANCKSLKNVTLSEGVQTIPGYTFQNCSALETINLENVTSLGSSSFYGCSSLKEVELSEALRTISDSAFYGCTALETINLENVTSVGSSSFSGCSSLVEADLAKTTSVSNNAFQNCTALESVNLENATSIGNYSFYGCTKLKEVTGCENLRTVSSYTFQNAKALETINLENVESIGTYSFSGCTALKNADLSSTTTISNYAFNGCTGMTDVVLSDTLTTIGERAFYNCDSLTDVEIPASVTSVGTYAFGYCDQLETVSFDPLNRMTSLSTYVFSNCPKLRDVALPQDLYIIPHSLFSNCTSLETVDMPRSLNIIDYYAFDGCSNLTDAALPAYVTEIRDYAFRNCAKLEDVTFPDTLTKIGTYAYNNCDAITEVTLPASLSSLGTYAFSDCAILESADLSRSTVTTVPDYCFRNDPKLETVLLPNTLQKIGPSAFNNDPMLSEITLPDSLTEIGNSAFSQCTSLSVINDGDPGVLEIPENVTRIGDSAFNQCNSLTEAYIPDSVTSLGSSAFANCANLEKAVVGEGVTTINPSVFYNDPKLKSVTFESELIKAIPSNAFYNCTNLEEFPLWEGLETIGTYAFYGCNGLSEITFPSTLKRIDNYAYDRCLGLTDLIFEDADPDSGTQLTIGNYAFSHYRANKNTLQHVKFPRQLTSIGDCAFSNEYSASSSNGTNSSYRSPLKEIEFPEDCELKTIGAAAFRNTSITHVELPGKVETIGNYAFRSNVYLESVTLPDSLKTIGTYAFSGNSALKSIDIPDSVTSIGTYAFSSCSAMTEAKLPNNLETLDNGVFSGCSKLAAIDLPETLKTIGSSTFSSCSSLKEIDLPATLTSIGSSAFSSCSSLKEVNLPEDSQLTSIGSSAFYYCTSLTSIDLPDTVTTVGASAFYNCTAMTEAKLPKNLETLDNSVFYNCYRLATVEMPETLKTIGNSTFYNCSALKEIDLPATLTSIGNSAFYGCSGMKEVTLPADSQLETVDAYAFYNCYALREIDLPDTVTTIGANAFENCRDLKTVDLSDNLKTINLATFRNCQNLTDIDLHNVENIGEESFKSCVALREIELPDTLKTISKNAFNGCAALETMDIPAGTTTIGEGAFTGCKNLDSMRWNAQDGSIGAFNTNTRFTLTIGKDVDNISSETLTNLFRGGAEEIKFEGGNFLTLPDTRSIADGARRMPRPLNDLEAGNYYADENGVLYFIKDGQATMVYIPDGLAAYTIPATLPGDIPVTGVKANALYQAQALTTLTIEAPEAMTNIGSSAFANARNLESVNGETTVAGATDLFTNPNLSIGNQVFHNTKLSDEPDSSSAEPLEYMDNDDPEQATLKLTITETGDGSRRGDRAGTPKPEGPMAIDPDTNAYLAFTGEIVVTQFQISNPASEVITDGQKVRVYVQLDEGGEIRNYIAGNENTITQTKQAEDGTTESAEYKFTLVETDVRGVYYFDFDRPLNGYTVTISLPTVFPSPTTGGGDAVIWAQYMTAEEATEKAGKAQPPAANHHTVNWGTHPDEFRLTKTGGGGATTVIATAADDGEVYVNQHTYTITMPRASSTALSVGRDNMAEAVFTDTFTIPDTLKVNETILEEVRTGKIRYRNDGSTKYIISPTYGNIFHLSVSGTSSFLTPSLSLNEDDNLQLQWTIQNSNPNYTDQGNEINLPTNLNVTVYNRVFAVKDKIQNQPINVHNNVSVDQYYCYSGKRTKSADAEYRGVSGSARLDFSKTSTSPARRGEYAPYTLQLRSTGVLPVTSTELPLITDDIESTYRRFYIPSAGIWQMFQEPHLGDALTLTVSKAHLYGGAGSEALANTRQTVTTVSGGTGTTNHINTGSQLHYSGVWRAEDNVTDTDATFTFIKEDGQVKVTLRTNESEYTQAVNSAADIQAFMDQHGFFVTRWTAYKAEWDTTKIENFKIDPGEDWRITIPTRLKDTFMVLEEDDLEYLQMESEASTGIVNTATAVYNGSNLSKTSPKTTYSNDANLSKGRTFEKSFFYHNEYTDLEIPEVVRYSVSATHYGNTDYGVMPLTDHMTLMQQLLVPVTQNGDKEWAEGLETYVLNGVSYYVLKEGSYKDVYTGNAWADHIIVEDKGSGNYDTKIFWYLNNYGGNRTNTISYLAKVEHYDFVPLQKAFSLYNESWLGDHEAHRLYDYVTESGVVEGEPLVTAYDKKIVGYIGDTSEGTVYSFVARGEEVIYRLTFASDLHTDFTINGTQFYDVLPKISSEFTWSRENVSLTYWNFATNDPDDSKWSIVPDTNNPASQVKIKWDDDFEMTCTSETGRAYIYVTVKFPKELDWDNYVRTHQGNTLYNTFYIKRNWLNWSDAAVMHELTDTAEVRLQKGVYATGGVNDENVDVYRTGVDSRLTYENNDVMKRKVYYYITLHNGGYTNLYLNDIQDVLPRGFTLASASKTSASESNAKRTPRIMGSSYATVSDPDGPGISYLNESNSTLSYRTEETGDGRQRIIITVKPYAAEGNGKSHYNARLNGGRYFLKPGETVVIRLDCFTNEYPDTDDIADNAIVMPYYDFYSQGLTIDSSESTSGNRASLTDATKNDGRCDVMDGTFVQGAGFSTAGQTKATQWLYSDVIVSRGQIQPGISKSLLKTIEINADGYEVENYNPGVVHPNHKLIWSVIAENEGSSAVFDYVMSDEMPAPYSFSGDVTFQQVYNGDGQKSPEIRLFTVRDRTVYEEDGAKKASPEMTFVTFNADGTEAASYPFAIGGEAVEMTVPNWRGGNDRIQVSVQMVNGNETMYVRFLNNDMCVLSGGSIIMTFCSQNLPALLQNKVFINRSYITPSAGQQSLWNGQTNEGSVTDWETPYGDGEARSVRSSAQVVTSYGGTTSSIKTIQAKADATNKTTSESSPNYITLPNKQSTFTYSLSVTNSTYRPITELVLIDNLPEENDHTTFQAEDLRDSAFRVLFLENPNFRFTVRDVREPNTVMTIAPDCYRVELSKKTTFSAADWSGSLSADWTALEDIPAAERPSYRSVRIVFRDTALNDNTSIFKRNYEVTLSFDAIIDGEDPEALPGRIAWNSFGYHYMDGTTPMEAAPLVVGIRIPDLPKVTKKLINSMGNPYLAEQEVSFTYVLYKGGAITVPEDKTIEEAVRDAKRDYATVTVTIPQGASEAEPVSFNGVTGHYWRNSSYQDGEWNMVNQAGYTICEVPVEYFESANFNGSRQKHYSFTYYANRNAYSIVSTNRHDDWNLKLQKTDQFDRPLGSAAFAIYTPLENERCMTAAEYSALSLQELNSTYGLALTEKPAFTRTYEGKQYYLYILAKTNDIGTLQFNELMAGSYLYQEIQRPSEHYREDSSIYRVERPAAGEGVLKTVSMENYYEASGDVTVDAKKVLEGRELAEGEFRFTLEGYDLIEKRPLTDADPQPPMPNQKEMACDAEGCIQFGPIPLTQEDIGKTYSYRISEMIPDDEQKAYGVTYDERKIIVKLTVTDGGDGQIDKTLVYSMVNEFGEEITLTGDGAMFRNTYRDTIQLRVKTRKNLEGRSWKTNDSYTFRLTGIPDPQDGEAPWDDITKSATVNQTLQEPTFVLNYTEQDIGHTYHYLIDEVINKRAVAYHADTGEPVRYNKRDLTYSKYTSLTDEEKQELPPAEKLRWKYNGIVFDGIIHELIVTIGYDQDTGKMTRSTLFDGEPLTDDTQAVFTNTYKADNVQAKVPVGKTIQGRPWKRPVVPGDPDADPYPDAYGFTIEAANPDEYTPLPEENKRTITIERSDTNPNTHPETQVGEFVIPYQWDDMLADGVRQESRDFYYIIREVIDAGKTGARIITDDEGHMTGYVLDQVTYDLTVRQVKITLRDDGTGGLETELSYLDEDGNTAGSLVKNTVPFVNIYQPEPIDVPIRLNKMVNGITAPEGSYTFTLFDEAGQVLKDDLTITAADGKAELQTVIEGIGTEFTSYNDNARTYTFRLKENIPADAAGYRNGIPLGTDGNALEAEGEPLTYAAANEKQADATITWMKDGMSYDAPEITITAKLEMDPLQYRLVSTETYSPDPNTEKSAVFTNHYEAEGAGTVSVRKTIDGRGFLGGESYTFELTPLDGAPLRTADGDQAKLTVSAASAEAVSFEELLFRLADLENSDGTWSGKDFRYNVHEAVPDNASVMDGEDELFYKDATDGQKQAFDGKWTCQGMTYAKDETVTLHVDDEMTGRLVVTYGTGLDESGTALFTNLYHAEGTGVIRVAKAIGGREFRKDDSFTFELTSPDGAPLRTADGDQKKLTVSATSAEAVSFDELQFCVEDLKNEDGTWSRKDFSYTIHEVIPDDVSVQAGDSELLYKDASDEQRQEFAGKWRYKGITYAEDQTVVLQVEDDSTGGLTVTCGNGLTEFGDATVINPYDAEGAGTISVKKTIEGRGFREDDSYQFELTALDGAPLRTAEGDQEKLTVSAASAEAVFFDELQFQLADLLIDDGIRSEKDFSYTIHEVVPDEASVQDGENELFYREATAEQKETYGGKWTLEGMIYAGDQVITLHVEDEGMGCLTVTYSGEAADPAEVTFTNEFHPELITTTLQADKAWMNYDGTTDPPAGAKVTFELYADGEATGRTVELDGTGDADLTEGRQDGEYEPWKATWNDLHVYRTNAEGTCIPEGDDYQRVDYDVKETQIELPEDSYAVYTAEEPEDGDASAETGKITITNKQETGSLIISKKVLSPIPEEEDKVFTFRIELSDETISSIFDQIRFAGGIAEVEIRGGESLKITGLPLDVDYTVTELADPDFTPDEEAKSGTIGAEDSTAAFINTRKTADVQVTKVFSGIPRLPADFVITNDYNEDSFTIMNAEGKGTEENPYTWTISAVPVGTVILFTETGIQANGYTLTVNGSATAEERATATATAAEEKTETAANMSPEETAEGGNEKTESVAAFTNIYTYHAEGRAELKGHKVIQNRPFAQDDTLKVTISAAEGVKLPAVTEIDVPLKEGEYTAGFSFGEIVYDQDDMDGETGKVFTYIFTETATMAGTTSDAGTHAAVVKVTDDGEGHLLTEVAYSDGEEVEFVNPYEVTETKGTLALEKRFVFRDAEETPAPESEAADTTPPPQNAKPAATPLPAAAEPEPEENIPTTSISVRKIWQDDNNAAGLRPDHVTVTLNNGMKVTLNEQNGWQATITELPLVADGKPVEYSWKETEVPGYKLVNSIVTGGTTIFVNELHQRGTPPEGKPVGKTRGDRYLVIEEYETALGMDLTINHVGDCFD